MSNFWGQNNRGRGRGRGRGGGGGGFGANSNDGNRAGANPLLSRLGNTSGQFGDQGYHPGGQGSGSGSGFGSMGPNKSGTFIDSHMVGNSGGTAQVSVKGWRGGTEDSLLKFLDTKLGRPVGVMDIHYRGEIMYITVPSADIAQGLLNLSGIRFAGDKLSFQLKTHPVKFGTGGGGRDGGVSNDSVKLKDRLIALLQTRVDMQSNSLDLSMLGQDKIIASLGTDAQQEEKMYKAILVIAAQIYPGLVTINLAGNGLRSLKGVADLGLHFPSLRNLSLMNNLLADFSALDCVSSMGSTVPLKHLDMLILAGNPMAEAELRLPNGGASYVNKVQQRFPTISMLDMNPVVPRAQPGAGPSKGSGSGAQKQLPFPTEQLFVENQEIGDLTNSFLAGFFSFYDNNRNALADIYDQAAQFSLVVDTTHPTSEFAQTSADSQKHVDFSVYIRLSRNLTRVKSPQRRISSLIVGRASVMQTILQLPETSHPVQDAQRFSFDAWQTLVPVAAGPPQTVAVVAVHGEFTERSSQNLVSFDRVFVLAPAPPGSPAAAAGSPCIITNDQLTIRRYNGFYSWLAPSASAGPAEAPATNTGTGTGVGAGTGTGTSLTAEQQEMARALQEQTGMNAGWTLKCLQSYGWNYQLAISEFPNVRNTLPPEAFQ
ncbi:nuclear mRNA export, poly(A)+RNA binding protein [Coemansia asiatica]|uniref:mRNA export factor MEX67 n=1 Tax=Coemansia asiatica TaxID=1052880 RepID=A0A9W8CJL2_9FUNG|nr:nuclear mRNA export, poly(A)+RNA binding protein [Coemansia asiatica]